MHDGHYIKIRIVLRGSIIIATALLSTQTQIWLLITDVEDVSPMKHLPENIPFAKHQVF